MSFVVMCVDGNLLWLSQLTLRFRITLAGLPATIQFDSTDLVNTEPAPTIAPSPTLFITIALDPIQTSFPMEIRFIFPPCLVMGVSEREKL